MTSADAVYHLKKFAKVKKCGHAGTLDPRATGMLIICTDKMTKRINEFMDMEKEYEGIYRIGAVTRTYDTESEEEGFTETNHITEEDLEKAASKFRGEIEQIPPMYSALKHKGKPLYHFARKGETVETKARKIFIREYFVKAISETEVFFKVVCSKGTYIRTLANDFGKELGVGAYLKELRRTKIGHYTLENLNEEYNGIKFRVL
jgi:tRNA pseudouridine55 synthase